ncbi:hypothetical protein GCM10027445_54980 [Amycolatopsis endophytica]|uniref:Uncharacterized protein n=1 Tax=Amycolatopsis endophytica TaxID=860233 RepID=A0A853B1I6_9PSEU|nr:hypothetical protein [Amycolatopsis endophytica]NYI88928.1 hypothetical protein [Amycolatopsis endophytica]
MAEPDDADSYVTIVDPEMNNGRPVLRFVRTTPRDAAAVVAIWCKTGYVHAGGLGDTNGVVINFGLVAKAVTTPGSQFRDAPMGVVPLQPSAADIAKAHAALARHSEL